MKQVTKERLQGMLMGVILATSLGLTIPTLARTGQETITVAFNNIRIAVNGNVVATEFDPFVFEGRTYLPVRDVANAVGYDVTWEATTNTVHLTSGQQTISAVPNYPAHNPSPQPMPIASTPTIPQPSSHSSTNRPSNPTISRERAIEIAETDLVARGIIATFHSDSGMDWERGQWVWELEFRVTNAPRGRHVIEYYINVDTGAIVKFEQGD